MASSLFDVDYDKTLRQRIQFENGFVQTLEICHYDDPRNSTISHGLLKNGDIDNWLDEALPITSNQGVIEVLRLLLYTPTHEEYYSMPLRRLPFSRTVFTSIMRKMGLPKPFLRMFTTTAPSGHFATFSDNSCICQTPFPSVTLVPQRIDLALSYDPVTCITNGLMILRPVLLGKIMLYLEKDLSLSRHLMLLPSIAFKVAVEYQTANINGADRRLIDLESNAGIADLPFAWALPQKRLQMNHSSMIKLLNGICIQLTHTEQALVSIRDCTKDILEEVHGMRVLNVDKADNQSDDAALEIKEFSCRIKSRCQSDLQYLHCIEKRAKNAIPAIFNLMAQRDTKLNLEVARDSKSLAAASKRDSSAMKSVAVVTIVFLPGTFLSVSLPVTASSLPSLPPQQSADTKKTLFAMPVFDWESSNGHLAVNNNFWIYWAFNVPLTVLTVAIWITWMRRDSLLKRRLEKEARASGGLGKPDEDDGSVADHDARFTGKRSQTDLGSRVWLEDLRRREKQQMGRPSMEPA